MLCPGGCLPALLATLALNSPVCGLLDLPLLLGAENRMRGLLRSLSWPALDRRLKPLLAHLLSTELAALWSSADSKGASLHLSDGLGADSSTSADTEGPCLLLSGECGANSSSGRWGNSRLW